MISWCWWYIYGCESVLAWIVPDVIGWSIWPGLRTVCAVLYHCFGLVLGSLFN
ncbi:hypothetical protein QBC45DRAFT_428477 [Copromyces sp. CBS 386.78]|nr:hypothetical protein QBC45DRAFT_428477 [Copromyces sp. CBS 386.78]